MTASTIADPGAVMTDRAARDADFAAYLQARQASVLRTAYLLSGDLHTAEDLTQTAFAKLYLAWDRVRDQGSIDGYLRIGRRLRPPDPRQREQLPVATRVEEARAHRRAAARADAGRR